MRIWIDDVRPMPKGFDKHFKSYREAYMFLMAHGDVVTHISFDHDLGSMDPKQTGYELARAIERWASKHLITRMTWAVHSANPVGKKNIEAAMKSAERFWDEDNE